MWQCKSEQSSKSWGWLEQKMESSLFCMEQGPEYGEASSPPGACYVIDVTSSAAGSSSHCVSASRCGRATRQLLRVTVTIRLTKHPDQPPGILQHLTAQTVQTGTLTGPSATDALGSAPVKPVSLAMVLLETRYEGHVLCPSPHHVTVR